MQFISLFQVILTVCDPYEWVAICRSTVLSPQSPLLNQEVARKRAAKSNLFRLSREMFSRTLGLNFATASDEQLASAFIKWNLHVVANVPKDKLLIYNPREGWGPLCRFLGFHEPTTPFPRGFKVKNFKISLQPTSFLVKVITITLLATAVILFLTVQEPFNLFEQF